MAWSASVHCSRGRVLLTCLTSSDQRLLEDGAVLFAPSVPAIAWAGPRLETPENYAHRALDNSSIAIDAATSLMRNLRDDRTH
jgi:hypothetical protein